MFFTKKFQPPSDIIIFKISKSIHEDLRHRIPLKETTHTLGGGNVRYLLEGSLVFSCVNETYFIHYFYSKDLELLTIKVKGKKSNITKKCKIFLQITPHRKNIDKLKESGDFSRIKFTMSHVFRIANVLISNL